MVRLKQFKLLWPLFFLSMIINNTMGSTGKRGAFDVFSDLAMSGILKDSEPLYVQNGYPQNGGMVTYGAEREGSTRDITNVAGITDSMFKVVLKRQDSFGVYNQTLFYKKFLHDIYNRGQGYEEVTTLSGRVIRVNIQAYKGARFNDIEFSKLQSIFNTWLSQTDGRPFSFIKPAVRKKIFMSQYPGVSKKDTFTLHMGHQNYVKWLPHFGTPEKYISGLVPAITLALPGYKSRGWEINFKPQKSYGEFEKMLTWFSEVMPGVGAPGHQRLVYPEMRLTESELLKMRGKTGEFLKNMQAYIVLEGLIGKTGIETAKWKKIIKDKHFKKKSIPKKGVMRLDGDRWAPNTQGLEIRSGTKYPRVQRFIETAFASRVATNDWNDIQDTGSWKLVPTFFGNMDTNKWMFIHEISQKYDFSYNQMITFFNKINKIKGSDSKDAKRYDRSVKQKYLVPLWNWENAPYIKSAGKKGMIHQLTQEFIHYIIFTDKLTFDEIRDALKSWAKSTKIQDDIINYLRPKKNISDASLADKVKVPVGGFDVNNVAYGGELTAQFAIDTLLEHTSESNSIELSDMPSKWLDTLVGYTFKERKNVIYKLARTFARKLGHTRPDENIVETGGGHGHNLVIAFKIKDPKGKGFYRVEWDGVNRSYDRNGNIIKGSERGGHIELVTPKFVPTLSDMRKIFEAFEENSLIPNHRKGGGHVNIDLAAFDGRPEALARFISLFHKYRGIIAVMFQNIDRLRSSEPVKVSETFNKQLQNFQGSTEDLKRLLYDKGYFNPRIGRKARYIQMDLSAYFQDVIPEMYLTQDYDIKNPKMPWRPQFKVHPKIRKMEFRMMNAPLNLYEWAKQIQLIRGLLNVAINGQNPINGKIQSVDYGYFVDNPQMAINELKKMTNELGLNFNEYNKFLGLGLNDAEVTMNKKTFRVFEDKIAYYPVFKRWEPSVNSRSIREGIISEDRDCEMLHDFQSIPEIAAFQNKEIKYMEAAQVKRYQVAKDKEKNGKRVFRRRNQNLGIATENILDL